MGLRRNLRKSELSKKYIVLSADLELTLRQINGMSKIFLDPLTFVM